MGSLINNIPVYKPQTLPVQQNRSSSNAINSVSSQFPQIMTYDYLPAETLSPARTTPRGVRAQKPSGRLVKENIFQSAGSTLRKQRRPAHCKQRKFVLNHG